MNEIELAKLKMAKLKRAIRYFENECKWYSEAGWGSDEDAIACEVALNLCRAELSRQENAPLTEDELPSIVGKPYYHVSLDGNGNEWKILRNQDAAKNPKLYHYRERWMAYRYEPKGEPPCTQD